MLLKARKLLLAALLVRVLRGRERAAHRSSRGCGWLRKFRRGLVFRLDILSRFTPWPADLTITGLRFSLLHRI